MVTIREYRDGDEAQLVALVRELQAHEFVLYERMKPAGEIGAWYIREVEKLCAENAGKILVAEDGAGALVGYASILTECSSEDDYDETIFSYGYVADLVVTESQRGRGIGRMLLDTCERLTRAAGRDELRVSVLASNTDTQRLYRHFGFAEHLITMRKRLV